MKLLSIKVPTVTEDPFQYIYFVNFRLFCAVLVTIWLGFLLGKLASSISLFVCFCSLVRSFQYAFVEIKPVLLTLEYSGRNRHLFSRNIAIFNLSLTSALAFLVGIFPAICNYFSFTESSTWRIIIEIMLAWLSCIASIQKNMLEHTRDVWTANRSRAGKLPIISNKRHSEWNKAHVYNTKQKW